ncbi:MAG: hypothetical protein KKD36_02905 [Bacteroidetes bacterium]|nr:hypothetical protein [Bacteroidota bacterium]
MKNFILIISLLFSSIIFAQKPIKFSADSFYFSKLVNGNNSYSKPQKASILITLDLEKRNIKIFNSEEHIMKIVHNDSPFTETTENTFFDYKCIDENNKDCTARFLRFSKSSKSEMGDLLYIVYPDITYVYNITLIKN